MRNDWNLSYRGECTEYDESLQIRDSKTGQSMSIQRAVWLHHKGYVPRGMSVVRTCRNHNCINMDHLQLMDKTEQFKFCLKNQS